MRENIWESFLERVVKFCGSHGIDVSNMNETYILRGGHACRQPRQFSKGRYFQVEIFLITIDT
jgi:hypothetical protein